MKNLVVQQMCKLHLTIAPFMHIVLLSGALWYVTWHTLPLTQLVVFVSASAIVMAAICWMCYALCLKKNMSNPVWLVILVVTVAIAMCVIYWLALPITIPYRQELINGVAMLSAAINLFWVHCAIGKILITKPA